MRTLEEILTDMGFIKEYRHSQNGGINSTVDLMKQAQIEVLDELTKRIEYGSASDWWYEMKIEELKSEL